MISWLNTFPTLKLILLSDFVATVCSGFCAGSCKRLHVERRRVVYLPSRRGREDSHLKHEHLSRSLPPPKLNLFYAVRVSTRNNATFACFDRDAEHFIKRRAAHANSISHWTKNVLIIRKYINNEECKIKCSLSDTPADLMTKMEALV